MSAYAILGAIGQTGSSILKLLRESSTANINVLVRSRSKLEELYLSLLQAKHQSLQRQYLGPRHTMCLPSQHMRRFPDRRRERKYTRMYDIHRTAKVVVRALRTLKEEDENIRMPRLVVLSAVSLDDRFWKGVPQILHTIMYKAAYYI